MAVLADLQEVLAKSVADTGLPGAAVAVLHDGEVYEAAAGVLNLKTGVETTTDSLFQIGSITKVYTSTLIMQLVDSGLVDLDATVRSYLPEFAVADADASAAITVRQLLTHTSGFDGGDFFFDGGRGDDTLAKYVTALSGLRQISAPGALWSYNNAGFTTLGRIVEVVTGQTWDAALRERLLQPAGLEHSVTLPEDALLFRTAAGHQAGAEGVELVRQWGLSRSAGPAGLICASAADVVGFARVHIEDGKGILSPASVKAMQTPQVSMPGEPDVHMGLGWMIRDIESPSGSGSGKQSLRTVSHNGGTLGQAAFLTTAPERGFAISLLTNGPTGGVVWQTVLEHVTSTLALPSHKAPNPTVPEVAPDLDLSKYVGRYERKAVHTTISIQDDKLLMTMEYVGIEFDLKAPPPMALTALDAQTFAVLLPDGSAAMKVQFLEPDTEGKPQLFFAARLARRAS